MNVTDRPATGHRADWRSAAAPPPTGRRQRRAPPASSQPVSRSNHRDQRRVLRAERLADADLVGPPRHAVRQDAVEADRGEQRATMPNAIESCASIRSCTIRRSTASVSVAARVIGMFGSIR